MTENEIYNEDCFITMDRMKDENFKVNLVLTSPPYCNAKDSSKFYSAKSFENYGSLYDVFEGFESFDKYREWSIELFKHYENILEENGVILYNISYTTYNSDGVYLVLNDIISNTDFTVADCISWKKNSALPMNMNANRLTRICEFIFVIVRKSELDTFQMNKIPSKNGKYKNLFFNYIEAPNNDIADKSINKLNNATFSTGMVRQLLRIYANSDDIVYDSFMGTGTTASACKSEKIRFIGSELSGNQIALAKKRLLGVNTLKTKTRRLFN